MNDTVMADVRRAHRLVTAYNRRLLDAVGRLTDALRDDFPQLQHVRSKSYRFSGLREKHDPTKGKWAWDFQPLAFADLTWESATRPEAGTMFLSIRHTSDTGLPDRTGGREPDPLRFEDASESSTLLQPVLLLPHGSLDLTWDGLYGELEEHSTYEGWGDGVPHTGDIRGVGVTYGGVSLDMATLAGPEDVEARLVEPMLAIARSVSRTLHPR